MTRANRANGNRYRDSGVTGVSLLNVTTPAGRHPETDYSGGRFGRPGAAFGTKAWRIKNGFLARSLTAGVTAQVDGQDAVTPALLTPGLKVYGGYYNGTFANLSAIEARFTSAVILSITPDGANGARCLDVEPGDARPGDAPAFFRNPSHSMKPDSGVKPMIYTSAGDVQAVVNAMTTAGIARGSYLIWSAHWIGRHICAPSSCGFPVADGTQYASNNSFDSSTWYTYCFPSLMGPPAPPPPPANPVLRLTNPFTTGAAVTTLQRMLNNWQPVVKTYPKLTMDGVFGAATGAAVKDFQTARNLAVDGVAGPATWAELLASPAPVPAAPPPPPAPGGLKQSLDSLAYVLSWNAVKGAAVYKFQLEWWKPGFGWVLTVDDSNGGLLQRTVDTLAASKYRWRVSSGTWSDWSEFNTPAA